MQLHQYGDSTLQKTASGNPSYIPATNETALLNREALASRRVPLEDVHDVKRLKPASQLPSTISESTRQRMLLNKSQSPGDTQVASQWFYDHMTAANGMSMGHGSVVGYHSQASNRSTQISDALFTQPAKRPSQNGEAHGHEEEEADLMSQDMRADIFPESKRFRPKTPASQGVKRKRRSPDESPDSQSPSLPVNPFTSHESNQAPLGLTQLFKTTQAQTSPPVPISDGLSERPSPDLHSVQRPSTAVTADTPVPLPRTDFRRAVTEPQTTYISMKESQEAREQRQRALEQSQFAAADSSDDEFSEVGSVVRRRLDQIQRENMTRQQLYGLSSRTQPNDVATDHGHKTGLLTGSSPIRPRGRTNGALIISDDSSDREPNGNITEEETEREEEGEEIRTQDDLSEENKENIGVEVPRTGMRSNYNEDMPGISQSSPLDHRNTRVVRASQAGHASSHPLVKRSQEGPVQSSASSQTYGVAGTQVSQPSHRPQEARLPSSSLGSRAVVPQSQISQIVDSSAALETAIREDQSKPIEPSQALPKVQNAEINRTINQTHRNLSRGSGSQSGLVDRMVQRFSGQSSDRLPPSTIGSKPASGLSAVTRNRARRDLTPDTRVPPSPKSKPKSETKSASKHSEATHSSPGTAFETAREHVQEPVSKSRVEPTPYAPRVPPSLTGSRSVPQTSAERREQKLESYLDDFDLSTLPDLVDPSELQEYSELFGRPDANRRPPQRRQRSQKQVILSDQPNTSDQPSSPLSEPPISPKLPTPLGRAPPSDIEQLPPSTRDSSSPPSDPRITPDPPAYSLPTSPMSNGQFSSQKDTGTMGPRADQETPRPVFRAAVPQSSQNQTDPLAGEEDMQNDLKNPEQPDRPNTAPSWNDMPVTAPNRVFAFFNGAHPAYYPATCVAIEPGDEMRYEVQFDDGNRYVVTPYGIKRAEFRPGDICKNDTDGERHKNYVVVGMCDHIGSKAPTSCDIPAGPNGPSIDNRGYQSVIVAPKQKAPNGDDVLGEELTIPIWHIYFTQSIWGSLKDRQFDVTNDEPPNGVDTPTNRASTPSTPSTTRRRIKLGSTSLSREADLRLTERGLFHSMAFSLTNISGDGKLEEIQHLIESQGGRVLDSGFDTLFNVPELALVPTTSSSSSFTSTSSSTRPKDKSAPTLSERETLQIKRSALPTRFTALISDRHCRRAKYIQALALGLPCLATRWITDSCLSSSLRPLAPYLLASGDSAFLAGAPLSRVLNPMPDPRTSSLKEMFEARPRMLQDRGVLLIMRKEEEVGMRWHGFLTRALGAREVRRCVSVEGAVKVLRDVGSKGKSGEKEEKSGEEGVKRWDYVYSHSHPKETERAINGGGAGKRKRGSGGGMGVGGGRGGGKVRVVGNEYVIQSLILGQLMD